MTKENYEITDVVIENVEVSEMPYGILIDACENTMTDCVIIPFTKEGLTHETLRRI
jgi:hypothetical protein